MFESPESTRVVTLMLTWACNLNCTYCFEKFKTSGREMSVETAMNILSHEFDMMRGMDKPGKLKVEFFGGEPLLKRRKVGLLPRSRSREKHPEKKAA